MTNWKKFFKGRLEELSEAEVVYDIGGGAQIQDRDKFKKYILVDINESYHPDIVADVQNLPFKDSSVGAILCLSVLEHVENPFRAVDELYRVLKKNGKALVSAPFIWPYHAAPLYKDYWRFSEDGLKILFRKFSKIEIVKAGGYFSALVNFIPFFTKIDLIFRPIASILDSILLKTKRSTTPAYFIFLNK